jgi:hypothetical protein
MAVWLRSGATNDPAVWLGVNNFIPETGVNFSFDPVFGADISTPTVSNIAAVTGGDGVYSVTLSGDASLEVSIDSGPFTATPADFEIPTNTTIQARLTSSASYQTLVTGTVEIDTTSSDFDVRTRRDPAAVGGFIGGLSIGLGIGLTKIKYNGVAAVGVESYASEYTEEYI